MRRAHPRGPHAVVRRAHPFGPHAVVRLTAAASAAPKLPGTEIKMVIMVAAAARRSIRIRSLRPICRAPPHARTTALTPAFGLAIWTDGPQSHAKGYGTPHDRVLSLRTCSRAERVLCSRCDSPHGPAWPWLDTPSTTAGPGAYRGPPIQPAAPGRSRLCIALCRRHVSARSIVAVRDRWRWRDFDGSLIRESKLA